MLHIYYGRESIDRDRFLFSSVKESLVRLRSGSSAVERIYVVVPDQFTLQAERNALEYLNEPGLLEVDILSQSRLGYRILSETAGAVRTHIDKYGRHMLIARILKERQKHLLTYGGAVQSVSFVEMVNDLITEMKQHNVAPEDIPNILESIEPESLLYRKLSDIYQVFEEYQERIAGKYIDTEDYTRLVTEQIPHSAMVRAGEFWFYGFDSFTPRMLALFGRLMACAADVNLVMIGDAGVCGPEEEPADGDLFRLAKSVMDQLRRMAIEQGTIWEQQAISDEFRRTQRPFPLEHLERQLYAWPHKTYEAAKKENSSEAAGGKGKGSEAADDGGKAIRFCRASSFYTEAETAAAGITALLRDYGYRCEDIAVICNDLESRGSVIVRVFQKYGIPVFLDKKRTVLHHPAVEYIMALLDALAGRLRYEEAFRLIKTGLTCLSRDEGEELENYVLAYRSAERDLSRPFRYGKSRYGEEGLARLEDMRRRVAEPIDLLRAALKKERTGLGKTRALYQHLAEVVNLPERLAELCDRLEQEGEKELLLETAQIWKVIAGLFDQIVELSGQEELSSADYAAMLNAGFAAVEIGLLPPSFDQIIVGTMQRTRTGRVKALLVLGANDGLLPGPGASEDLLSEGEKDLLLAKDIQLCKNDSWRVQEEKIAIYKNLSKPSERLWISYTAADGEGGAVRPSLIYEKLRSIFPGMAEEADIVNEGNPLGLIQGRKSTLEHLTRAMRGLSEGEDGQKTERRLPAAWIEVLNWYLKEAPDRLHPMREGLLFDNRVQKLDRQLIERIYKKEGYDQLVLSPSRLERFGHCPFQHFLQYGLRPEERRVFEVSGREAGDVYHQCLMELSRWLSVPGTAITDASSPWMTIAQEECREKVSQLMDQIADAYSEAVLRSGGREGYRLDRMKRICFQAAWALIQHVRQGKISRMYLEAGFGRGRQNAFPPIDILPGVRVEGKIDRVDILPGSDGSSYVKIIDYKSGREKFQKEEAVSGWRLQLMLYLEGAVGGSGAHAKPAGVFYFRIDEPSANVTECGIDELSDKIDNELIKSFQMNGLMVEEPEVISEVAGDFVDESQVVALRRKRDGALSKSSESLLLSAEEFGKFRQEVGQTIRKLCTELAEGEISPHPQKVKDMSACTYCGYQSVCYFDTAFSGCRYRK